MKKDLVIVGGGTAGWITALVAQKNFPEHNVTLVESAEIGILGAGEGSTPQLPDVLEHVDISLDDLIQHTSCTIKNGIIFEGWSEDRRPYLNGFGLFDKRFDIMSLNYSLDIFGWPSPTPVIPYLAERFDLQDDQIDILTHGTLKNKVFFEKDFSKTGLYSVHFDAQSIAKFLAKKAIERGVRRIEGKVTNVVLNERHNISHVTLENDQDVHGDFFFDCSGFARLIIGKTYGSEWVSFKDTLPAKRAMPFFIEQDKIIKPYTKAKAMDYGWMWQIPLQHRYGCGYVYDPDQISDDDVKLEIDQLMGYEVTVPRIFKFDPGYFKQVWIKNCLALGLASSFVEPLEATSIMQMLTSIQDFLEQKHMIFTEDEEFKIGFNQKTERDQIAIGSFIHLHYITNKKNNEFWANFSDNYKAPEALQQTLKRISDGVVNQDDQSSFFDAAAYITIARGNGTLKQDNIQTIYDTMLKDKKLEPYLYNLVNQVPLRSNDFLEHNDLLKHLGAKIEK